MRIVDGPDEVHLLQLGKNENKRGKFLLDRIQWQIKKGEEMAKTHGIVRKDPLELNRVSGGKSKL